MPLPRSTVTETAEQKTARETAYKLRWHESANDAGVYQMVHVFWSGHDQSFVTMAPGRGTRLWNGDMQGMRFVTIG